jgi:glycerol kinase
MPVERPEVTETTALGAAYLAGLGANIYKSLDEVKEQWQCNHRFEATVSDEHRNTLLSGWAKAVEKVND